MAALTMHIMTIIILIISSCGWVVKHRTLLTVDHCSRLAPLLSLNVVWRCLLVASGTNYSWFHRLRRTVQHLLIEASRLADKEAVYRALDSRSEGLGFDSHCWPCVEVLGKFHNPHCLGPPSLNGYMVHRSKVGSIVAGCMGAHLARGKVKSVEHMLSWSLDNYVYLYLQWHSINMYFTSPLFTGWHWWLL